MRDSQHQVGVEVVAQGPAARRAFDDCVGIDEDAVEVEEQGGATEFHDP